MLCLNEPERQTLVNIVLDFLLGANLHTTQSKLVEMCEDKQIRSKSLYQAIQCKQDARDALENPSHLLETLKNIEKILAKLNIKKCSDASHPGRYEVLIEKSDTLYDLLKNLSYDGHHQVATLLDMIDKTKPSSDWTIAYIAGALATVGLGGVAIFNRHIIEQVIEWLLRTFPKVMRWLEKTFSVLRNISLLGILLTSISFIWSVYHLFANGTTHIKEKWIHFSFKFLAAGLNISGYTLSYLTAGAATLFSGAFFILASSVKVFVSIFIWWQSFRALKKLDVPAPDAAWEVQAEYERARNLYQRAQHSVWVQIVAAVLTTITVAVWSFFPAGIIITVVCVAFLAFIALAEGSILTRIEAFYAKELQNSLQKLTELTTPRLELVADSANDPNIQKLSESLQARELALVTREEAVKRKEEALSIAEREMATANNPQRFFAHPAPSITCTTTNEAGQTIEPTNILENAL